MENIAILCKLIDRVHFAIKPRLDVVTQNVLGIRKIKKMKWHAHWILLGTKTTLKLKK
jgi:hypothetical protein